MATYKSTPAVDAEGRMRFTGLRRGDLAPAVLLPGDPGRSKLISSYFKKARFVGQKGAFAAYTGETENGTPISVMSSGMGCMNVSVALEELSALGVKTVIRVGTGGGLQNPFQFGTLVIATGCVRGEGASYEYVPPEFPAVADYRVVRALNAACAELGESPRCGLYRSHDAFYMESPAAHTGVRDRLAIYKDANVQLIENESGTLFTLAHLLGMRASSICVGMGSLFDDGNMKERHALTSDPGWLKSRVELASRAAVRAVELLAEREARGDAIQ